MSKTIKRLLTIVIVLVILLVIFYPKLDWLHFNNKAEDNATNVSAGGGPERNLTVSGVVVQPRLLENKISVTGEIMANESLDLKSEMSGKIDRIYFKEGATVRRGALLVKINVDELLAQLKKARYTQKLQEETEFRQRQLLEREAISQEEYDQALTEMQTAEADIQLLETQIAKSEIRAPFDGIVGLRNVSEGAFINSSTVIAPFYSINPVKIQFSVPGKYSGSVKAGTKVTFTTDATSEVFNGEVYAIEPRLDPQTRTLRLRALSSNPQGILLPGQFARVVLTLETKEKALMVPTEAVVPELNGTKVYVADSGRVGQTWVETGIRTETELEILSGLNPGDTVITTGILQIRQGMPVNIRL